MPVCDGSVPDETEGWFGLSGESRCRRRRAGSTDQQVDEAIEGGVGARLVKVEVGSQPCLMDDGVVGDGHVLSQPLLGSTDGFGIFRRRETVWKSGATA